MKIITLDKEQFDSFARNHRYRHYYQSAAYGNVMEQNGLNVHYVGFIDDDEHLFGASIFLYKEVLVGGGKYVYAPRGILIDYQDQATLKLVAERLKKLLFKQNFIYLKIDPLIPAAIHDKKGEVITYNPEVNDIMESLKNAGFVHHGMTTFFDSEKPRWEAITVLQKDTDALYKSFDKRTRNKIQKALRSGIEIIKEEGNDVSVLYEFVKNKHDRPLEYYERMAKEFSLKDGFDIYYAKLNPEKYVTNSKSCYEKELDRNQQLNDLIQSPKEKGIDIRKIMNQKMESDKLLNIYKNNLIQATNLLQQHPNGILISAGANIRYDNAAYLLIEGYNKQYRDLNPNYLLKWHCMKTYAEEGLKYFNLNAVAGDFEQVHKYSGLNEMKLGYHTVVTEYIGEFDLIINPITYSVYKGVNKEDAK